MRLRWTLSGPAAFDGFRLEWPALTSLAVKPGKVPLAISRVRIVRLMIGFTLRSSLLSFIEITDIYIVHDSIGPLTLAHMVYTIVSDYAGVVVGLVVRVTFQHTPHLTRPLCLWHLTLPDSSLRIRHRPRYLFIQTLMCFGVGAIALTDYFSFLKLSLISFVIAHRPTIPTTFIPMCFWDALNRIALMHLVQLHPSALTLLRYLVFNFVDKGWKIVIHPIPDQSFFPFSRSAGRLRVMVIGL